MKELYFKGFGYKGEDGTPLYACFGVIVEYKSKTDLEVINTFHTIKVYRNINNGEEANLVAGLDIYLEAIRNRFIVKGDVITCCLTSGLLFNHYDQFFYKSSYNKLLSDRQRKLVKNFNSTLNGGMANAQIKIDLTLGIKSERTMLGMEILGKIEDSFIQGVQYNLDTKNKWKIQKNKKIDAEVKSLNEHNNVLGHQMKRMRNDDNYSEGVTFSCYDYRKSLLESSKEESNFLKIDQIYKKIKSDRAYEPTLQHYF